MWLKVSSNWLVYSVSDTLSGKPRLLDYVKAKLMKVYVFDIFDCSRLHTDVWALEKTLYVLFEIYNKYRMTIFKSKILLLPKTKTLLDSICSHEDD